MESTMLVAGIVCLIGAIVGGGLKAFQIELPLLESVRRQAALASLGAILIGGALLLSNGLPEIVRKPAASPDAGAKAMAPAVAGQHQLPNGLKADNGVIRLGMLDGESVRGRFALKQNWLHYQGDKVTTSLPVTLWSDYPDAVPKPHALGEVRSGTRLLVMSTKTLDSGEYWAEVELCVKPDKRDICAPTAAGNSSN